MIDEQLFFPVIGVVSFVLGIVAFAPYIRDILAGKTRPQRSSWLIWVVVASIALASQVAEGAGHSLWFLTANWGVTFVIFALSIWFGAGDYVQRRDLATLLLAAGAIGVWMYTDVPVYALAIAIGVNALGAILTVVKAYEAPKSETCSTWALGSVAACLGLVSVGTFDPFLLAYPLYLLVLQTSVTVALLAGRRRHAVLRQNALDPLRSGIDRPLRRSAPQASMRTIRPLPHGAAFLGQGAYQASSTSHPS